MITVAFAGGKPLGSRIFKYLTTVKDIDIVGVFVNPEDSKWYDDMTVTEQAINVDIPVFKNINHVKILEPDLVVVAYYDRILKKDVISIPPLGCVNVHMALAEEYRGCYPTTHAIINGENITGVTIHYIDEGVDTGDIIAQKYAVINDFDTGKDLYMRLVDTGYSLFVDTFPSMVNGTARARKQVTTVHTKYHRKVFPSYTIEYTGNGEEFYNSLRALIFPPFPMPMIKIGDRKYRLEEVQC